MVRELRMLLATWAIGFAQRLWPKDDKKIHQEIGDLCTHMWSKR